MKDEKELWLDENEVMSLLEGKATWDQIHGKSEGIENPKNHQPPNNRSAYDNRSGFYGRNDRAGRVDSGWDTAGSRRGSSPGNGDFQNTLTPGSTPMTVSRYTTGSVLPKPQYMTRYQAQKAPQVLPGPASGTDWLRPQNPHIKMIEPEDQNIFLLQKSQNGTQKTEAEHSRPRSSVTAIPTRDMSARGTHSMDFGKMSPPEHRISSKQRGAVQLEESGGFFDAEKRQEGLSWKARSVSDRRYEKGPSYDMESLDDDFFQVHEQEEFLSDNVGLGNEPDFSEGFFESALKEEPSREEENFFSDSTVGTLDENYFEPERGSNVSKRLKSQEVDVGFVSLNPNVTDIRRAPTVRIASHTPSRKRQLVLTGDAATSSEQGPENDEMFYGMPPQERGKDFEPEIQEEWAVKPRNGWTRPKDEGVKPRTDNKVVNINRGAGKGFALTGPRLSFDDFDKMSEPSVPSVPIVSNDKFIMGPRTHSGKTGTQYRESDLSDALDKFGWSAPSDESYTGEVYENPHNTRQLGPNNYTEGDHQYKSKYNDDQFPVSLFTEQNLNIPVPRQYASVPNQYARTPDSNYSNDLTMTNPNLKMTNPNPNPNMTNSDFNMADQYGLPLSARDPEDKIDQLHRSMRAEEYDHHGDYNRYGEFDHVANHDRAAEQEAANGYDHMTRYDRTDGYERSAGYDFYEEPGNYSTDSIPVQPDSLTQGDVAAWNGAEADQADSVAYYEENSPYQDNDPLSAYEMLAEFDGPELENTFERFEDTGRFRYDFGELDNTLGDSQSFPKFAPGPSGESREFGVQRSNGAMDSAYGPETRGRREYDDDDDDKNFSSDRRSMRISQRKGSQYETQYAGPGYDDDEKKGFRFSMGWVIGGLSLIAAILVSIILYQLFV